MKKTITILLALMLVLSLAACGEDSSDTGVIVSADGPTAVITATPAGAEKTPEPTPEATPEAAPEPTPEPTPEAAPEPTPEPVDSLDSKTVAESFIGASLDELIAAIGEPESSDYAPSCLGPGEDGNLYYDGFIVYTYREDGTETVEYVE